MAVTTSLDTPSWKVATRTSPIPGATSREVTASTRITSRTSV